MTAWQKGGMTGRRQHMVVQLSGSGRATGRGINLARVEGTVGATRGARVRLLLFGATNRRRGRKAAWQKGGMARVRGPWECEPLEGSGASSVAAGVVGSAATAVGCSAVDVARIRHGRKSAWQKVGLAKRRVLLHECSSPARKVEVGGGVVD